MWRVPCPFTLMYSFNVFDLHLVYFKPSCILCCGSQEEATIKSSSARLWIPHTDRITLRSGQSRISYRSCRPVSEPESQQSNGPCRSPYKTLGDVHCQHAQTQGQEMLMRLLVIHVINGNEVRNPFPLDSIACIDGIGIGNFVDVLNSLAFTIREWLGAWNS